jgi:hypothetical protein
MFERSEGRPVTGLATAELLRRLNVVSAERMSRQIAGTPARIETGSVGSHQQMQARPTRR